MRQGEAVAPRNTIINLPASEIPSVTAMTKYWVLKIRTGLKNLAVDQSLRNNHDTNYSFKRRSGLLIRYVAQFGAHSFVVVDPKVILCINGLKNNGPKNTLISK